MPIKDAPAKSSSCRSIIKISFVVICAFRYLEVTHFLRKTADMKKLIIILICSWLSAVCFNYVSQRLYPVKIKERIRIVPPKKTVEILDFDHDGLAADLLFIQVVLHSGSLSWKPLDIPFDSQWSYQMIDLVTRLDPKYYSAYLFTGMGLIHSVKDAERARPILERGMRQFPKDWEIPFWIGYGAYVYLQDYETAGIYFWQSANLPNAPKSFLSLMLSSLKRGGRYKKAVLALKRLIENTKDANRIRVYKKRIQRLRNVIKIKEAVKKYKSSKGHTPQDLQHLVKTGLLSKIPKDPMGSKYCWNAQKNKVEFGL